MNEPTKRECPYGGCRTVNEVRGGVRGDYWDVCGDKGWLCDRCKEDRADNRTTWLVTAIAGLRIAIEEKR